MDRFQHVVLFKFPRGLTAEEEEQFVGHVRSWPEAIDVEFLALRLGRDVSGRARGHQYCLFTEFETEERMKAYQAHPVHQAFGAWVYERECEVLAFDYRVDDATRFAGA
jgi:Stress responsive A/B Barrel Domain